MSTFLEPTALDVARAVIAADAQTRERIANWYADRQCESLMAMAVTLNESVLRIARALLAAAEEMERLNALVYAVKLMRSAYLDGGTSTDEYNARYRVFDAYDVLALTKEQSK